MVIIIIKFVISIHSHAKSQWTPIWPKFVLNKKYRICQWMVLLIFELLNTTQNQINKIFNSLFRLTWFKNNHSTVDASLALNLIHVIYT